VMKQMAGKKKEQKQMELSAQAEKLKMETFLEDFKSQVKVVKANAKKQITTRLAAWKQKEARKDAEEDAQRAKQELDDAMTK